MTILKELLHLFENPELVDDFEFGLENKAANKDFAAKLLKKKKETIKEDDKSIFFRTGDDKNGYFVLYNKTNELAEYLIKYESLKRPKIGPIVTQVALWRKPGSTLARGITKNVFFNILLDRWPAIMTDGQQTSAGRRFWLDRMPEAIEQGLEVGFHDETNNSIEWFDGDDVVQWATSKNAWGKGSSFKNYRFVIAKR